MKIDRFFYMLTFCAVLAIGFVGCSSDDDPEPEPDPNTEEPGTSEPGTDPDPDPEPQNKAFFYILNGGNQGTNDAAIASFSEEAKLLENDIYKNANGSNLGDMAESMIVYGTKIYVTVTGSNIINILDLDGKLLKSITPNESEPMGPRHMAVHDGKVYITYFYGHAVAALDTVSLSIVDKVQVGRYPEQLAVADSKIYVTNSGGPDYPNYGKTVSVVDIASFKQTKEIEVLLNPTEIVSDSQGDLYVISTGNYGDVKNTLQRIDAETNLVEVIANATKMVLVNDMLYTVYAQYGAPEQIYCKYNTLTEEYETKNLLVNSPNFSFPTLFDVDPETGKIYIGDSVYGSTASLYIFNADGTLQQGDIDTGGTSPKSIYFLR